MLKAKFTDKFLGQAKPAAGQRSTRYFDSECTGLIARVGQGTVTFYARAGATRYKIGPYPSWTIAEARKRCQEIRRQVAAGEDPQPRAKRLPTVKEAFEDFAAVRLAKRRPSTAREYRRQLELYVFPKWGDQPLDRLTRSDVVDLHAGLTAAGKGVRANRVIATVSSLYGWLQAARAYAGVNPAAKVERNQEHGRTVYLTPEQVTALRDALEAYAARPDGRSHGNDVAADCLLFIIATGCRSGEAKAATWSQFDAALTVWTKQASATKQRRTHRVPLGPAAQTVLMRRRGLSRDSESVFPGKFRADHIGQLDSAWGKVAKAAGLEGVRIHDLRHTFASLAVSAGVPLATIGGLLGHAAVQTTARYSHLFESDLRAAAGAVNQLIDGKKR